MTDAGKLADGLRPVASRRLHQCRAADARQPRSRRVGDPAAGDLIKTNANGAELGPVLETIENALRADQAISIAALSDLADRRRGSTGDLRAELS